MARSIALLSAVPFVIGSAPAGRLDVEISGMRSDKGRLFLCLTRQARHFPDCEDDSHARIIDVAAAGEERLVFDQLPSGSYALSVFHDENGNGRLDTFLGMPREGFGFSRNPPIRFGPPRFGEARFDIAAGTTSQSVKMRYLL